MAVDAVYRVSELLFILSPENRSPKRNTSKHLPALWASSVHSRSVTPCYVFYHLESLLYLEIGSVTALLDILTYVFWDVLGIKRKVGREKKHAKNTPSPGAFKGDAAIFRLLSHNSVICTIRTLIPKFEKLQQDI